MNAYDKFKKIIKGEISQCKCCIHYKESVDADVCDAFPFGIPEDILNNYICHSKSYAGDNGIRFEPKPGFESIKIKIKECF